MTKEEEIYYLVTTTITSIFFVWNIFLQPEISNEYLFNLITEMLSGRLSDQEFLESISRLNSFQKQNLLYGVNKLKSTLDTQSNPQLLEKGAKMQYLIAYEETLNSKKKKKWNISSFSGSKFSITSSYN